MINRPLPRREGAQQATYAQSLVPRTPDRSDIQRLKEVDITGSTANVSAMTTKRMKGEGTATGRPKHVFTREELERKLTVLAKRRAPRNLAFGADCYSRAAPPNRSEYVCPVCGEKTLYADSEAWNVEEQLPTARELVAELAENLEIRLDESAYCRHCKPNEKKLDLAIEIRYSDSSQANRISSIDNDDLRLIAEFLAGKNRHDRGMLGETPLNRHKKRLGELLGLKQHG